MDASTYRNFGLPAMILGALIMSLSLLVAGNARLTMTIENSEANSALMHEAWVVVAGGAVFLMAGTLALEQYRRKAYA
ncbi:MAG: hypothetical protein WDA16_14490 [Candidatus Thermoplasmatota archaeon]